MKVLAELVAGKISLRLVDGYLLMSSQPFSTGVARALRTPIPLHEGPTFIISFHPNYLLKGSVFKHSHIEG